MSVKRDDLFRMMDYTCDHFDEMGPLEQFELRLIADKAIHCKSKKERRDYICMFAGTITNVYNRLTKQHN